MKIVHHLKKSNNYSYHTRCPLCGAKFAERIKYLEDASKRVKHIEDTRLDFPNVSFNFHCSRCLFEIEYYFEDENKIIEVN